MSKLQFSDIGVSANAILYYSEHVLDYIRCHGIENAKEIANYVNNMFSKERDWILNLEEQKALINIELKKLDFPKSANDFPKSANAAPDSEEVVLQKKTNFNIKLGEIGKLQDSIEQQVNEQLSKIQPDQFI